MIEGVRVKQLKVHRDIPDIDQGLEPGIFMEVLRDDDHMMERFGQSNFTIASKGTIKAFHWHKFQDDIWFLASGQAAIVLFDRRKDSKTFGQTEVIYGGTADYKIVLIPKGVVHGYKVLSNEPCLLFYHVTKAYDKLNPDEERMEPYDKTINFDWKSLKEEK